MALSAPAVSGPCFSAGPPGIDTKPCNPPPARALLRFPRVARLALVFGMVKEVTSGANRIG
jgi:hypothetical protein